MADRYWVGGTGTWNTSSTTNWSTSSGGSSGASVPTASDNVFFDSNSGSGFTVTVTGAATCLDFNWTTSNTCTLASGTGPSFVISGSLNVNIYCNWTSTANITFNSTSTGKTISCDSSVASALVTFNGVGGGWTLTKQMQFNAATLVTLTNGTLALGSYSLITGKFNTGIGTKTLDFGTGRIVLNYATATNLWDTKTNLTNTTFSGTTNVYINGGSTGTQTILVGTVAESQAISFEFGIFATGTFGFTNADTIKNLKFSTGGGATIGNNAITIYGNLTNNSGAAFASGTNTWTFAATSGTQTLGGNQNTTYDFPITFNGSSSTTYTLGCNVTVGITRTTTLTQGTLSLGSYTFSTGVFLTGVGTKTIDFGTGQITVTHNLGTTITVWDTATNLSGTTFSGTSNVVVNTTGTGIKTINTGALSEATSLNFTITASAGFPVFTAGNTVKNLTLNGAFTFNNAAITIYGNTTITAVTAFATGTNAWTFGGTSGVQTISNPSGVALTFPLNFNGVGGTFRLGSAITVSRAQAGIITLTNGTLDLNGYTLTQSAAATSTFLTAAGTKNITFNGGSIVISTSVTGAFNNAAPTGFTTTAGTGVGSISMAGSTAKTFIGGGSVYNCTLNQGGAGALTVSDANTFNNISSTYANTTAANTISFAAGTTTTVNSFTAQGASGRLFTINSATAGTKATLALAGGSTATGADYLNIKDISFTPFATDGTAPYKWYLGANSTNSGNNTGALFIAAGLIAYALASGSSWTVPTDWNNSSNTIHLFGAGGGGGGSRSAAGSRAGGGGGGGGGYTQLTNQTLSGTVSYSIGTGGTAGASAGGAGGAGGTTSWNSGAATAGGGGGGSTTATPTSVGGTGGTGSTFNGGAGGVGSTNTGTTNTSGGGGSGAGGPNGVGKVGGTGTATAGGGGGGNGGGTNATGTAGGNNSLGSGGGTGGASPTAGFNGGGGGGSTAAATAGAVGGVGIDVLGAIGGGGGAGASFGITVTGTTSTSYGGGGSGAGGNGTGGSTTGGAGGSGLIVIVYTPFSGTYSLSISEAGTAADIVSQVMTAPVSVTEAGTATDAVDQVMTAPVSITETGTAADDISQVMTASISVIEAGTALDDAGQITSAPVSVTEAGTATDDVSETTPVVVSGTVDESISFTNIITYSEQFDNAAWIKTIAGGGTAPAVTANAGVAPDGTTTADRVVFVAPTTADQSIILQQPTTTSGTYTGSVHIKANSSGDVGKIIGFRQVAAGTFTLITLTDSWQRVSSTEVRAVNNFQITLRPALGTSSGTVTVLLWGAQLETGSRASPYIPTTTTAVTVTGAQDQYSEILTVPAATSETASASDSASQVRTLAVSISESAFLTDAYSYIMSMLVLISGIPSTIYAGTSSIFGYAKVLLSGLSVITRFGNAVVNTVVFNYNAVANLYDRYRTVYVEKKSTAKERTLLVDRQDRTIYVEAKNTSGLSKDRTVIVASQNRKVYIERKSTSKDRVAFTQK
jgi:hypothetical protein